MKVSVKEVRELGLLIFRAELVGIRESMQHAVIEAREQLAVANADVERLNAIIEKNKKQLESLSACSSGETFKEFVIASLLEQESQCGVRNVSFDDAIEWIRAIDF